MKTFIKICVVALLFIGFASCNGYYRFFITQRPVPPVIVRIQSPGPGHIWIEGEWFWNGNTYLWRNGYWTLPNNGYAWMPGSWKKRNPGGTGVRDIGGDNLIRIQLSK